MIYHTHLQNLNGFFSKIKGLISRSEFIITYSFNEQYIAAAGAGIGQKKGRALYGGGGPHVACQI